MPPPPTTANPKSTRALERLLAQAVFQTNALSLTLPEGEQFIFTPDALFNRFLQVHRDLKGHYSSGFGDYGKSLNVNISLSPLDFVFPGLEAATPAGVKLSFGASAESIRENLILVHRNLPGSDVAFRSLAPVGLFVLVGKKQTLKLKVKATSSSSIPVPSANDYLNIALGLEIEVKGEITAKVARFRDLKPRFFPSSTADGLKVAFKNLIGVPTLGDMIGEVKQWYLEVLGVLIGCFKDKLAVYKAAKGELEQIKNAEATITEYKSKKNKQPKKGISLLFKNVKSNLAELPKLLNSKAEAEPEDTPIIKLFNALSYYELIGDFTGNQTPSLAALLKSIRETAETVISQHALVSAPVRQLISGQEIEKLRQLLAAINQMDLDQPDAAKAGSLRQTLFPKANAKASQQELRAAIEQYYQDLKTKLTKAADQGAKDSTYNKLKNSKETVEEINKLLKKMRPAPSLFSWTKQTLETNLKNLKTYFDGSKKDDKTSSLLQELKVSANTKAPIDAVLGTFQSFFEKYINQQAGLDVKLTELPVAPDSLSAVQEINKLIAEIETFLQNEYWQYALTVAGADFTQLRQGIDFARQRLAYAKTGQHQAAQPSGSPPSSTPTPPAVCRLDTTSFTVGASAKVQGKAVIAGTSNLSQLLPANLSASSSIEGLVHYNAFRYQHFGYLSHRSSEKFIQTQDTLLKQKELLILGKGSVSAGPGISKEKEVTGAYTQITYKSVISNWFENSPTKLERGSGLVYGCSVELGRIRTMLDLLKNNTQGPLSKNDTALLQQIARKLRVNEATLTEALRSIDEQKAPEKALWDTETVFIESSFAFYLEKINPELKKLEENVSTTDMLSIAPVKKYRTFLSNSSVSNPPEAPVPADNIGYLEAIHMRLILAKQADNSKTIFGFTPTKPLPPGTSAKISYGKVDRAELESVVELACKFFSVQGQTQREQFDNAVPPVAFVHQAHNILNVIAAGSQDPQPTKS